MEKTFEEQKQETRRLLKEGLALALAGKHSLVGQNFPIAILDEDGLMIFSQNESISGGIARGIFASEDWLKKQTLRQFFLPVIDVCGVDVILLATVVGTEVPTTIFCIRNDALDKLRQI